MTTTTYTQYALTFRGKPDLALTFATRVDVDDYVARAVSIGGQDAADYGVVHRSVTYGEWAETTPAAATMDARRAARA